VASEKMTKSVASAYASAALVALHAESGCCQDMAACESEIAQAWRALPRQFYMPACHAVVELLAKVDAKIVAREARVHAAQAAKGA
jgi:hypothetical protein